MLGDERFDLIYTGRVLQHVEPRYAVAYVREFVHLLAPGGYLSFDVPSEHGLFVEAPAGAVPFAAMRAQIDILEAAPLRAAPGAPLRLATRVRNDSATTWIDTPGQPLNVAAHWLRADGTMLLFDGPRVRLPAPLGPGEATAVQVEAVTPEVAGVYGLQVDVVQEGVAWFAWHGSAVAETRVVVGDAVDAPPPTVVAPAPRASAEGLEPVMEMHAVPRAEVEAILAAAGARLLDVRRVHHCGPTWLAFRYDVTC